MNLREALELAIDTGNARVAGRAVDQLRLRGWTYARILAYVQRIRPTMDADDWESFMEEADYAEAHDDLMSN